MNPLDQLRALRRRRDQAASSQARPTTSDQTVGHPAYRADDTQPLVLGSHASSDTEARATRGRRKLALGLAAGAVAGGVLAFGLPAMAGGGPSGPDPSAGSAPSDASGSSGSSEAPSAPSAPEGQAQGQDGATPPAPPAPPAPGTCGPAGPDAKAGPPKPGEAPKAGDAPKPGEAPKAG